MRQANKLDEDRDAVNRLAPKAVVICLPSLVFFAKYYPRFSLFSLWSSCCNPSSQVITIPTGFGV